jgi:hypothetical protein
MKMTIAKENHASEAEFQYSTVKNLQIFGTNARVTIEFDLAKTVKDLAWDVSSYGISKDQLDHKYLAEIIARQLDWDAFVLSTNDDHELAHVFADINGN